MEDRSLEHPPHLSVQHAPTSQGPLQKMPPGVSPLGPTPPHLLLTFPPQCTKSSCLKQTQRGHILTVQDA